MRFILLWMLCVCSVAMKAQSAQQKIDSLLQVAETATDSIRLRILNKVSFYYVFNNPEAAQALLKNGISESKNKKVPFSEAELTNTYGIYYDVSGKPDSAKYYFENALAISQQNDFKTITVMIINNLGMFNWNKGKYQEALDYFFQALAMNKNNTSDKGDGVYLNNIGLIYQEMGQPDRALEYHKKSLTNREKYGDKSAIAVSLNNIGLGYMVKKDYKQAEDYFTKAVKMAEEANEKGKYFDVLNSLGRLYITTNKPNEAIPKLTAAFEGRNKLNIDRRANFSTIASLIEALNDQDRLAESSRFIALGNDLVEEFPDARNDASEFYQHASETYFRTNQPEIGAEFLERSIAIKEEIFSSENAAEIATLETKFKMAEKEISLATTRANLAETELKVKKRNNIIYGSLGLALILGLLGFLFYNQQKLKNRQLKKEAALKTALTKIETQNKLQEQRLRISRDLHDNIGSQLTFIISSIDNLKFGLQEAKVQTKEKLSYISEFTSQTIYELRDTIWAMNKEEITFEDLQGRISNFINKAKIASEKTQFTFTVSEAAKKETHFSSVEGMNVYRIIQEAVNNALKYADASSINVSITKSETLLKDKLNLVLTIIDNGKGFDLARVEKGNGFNSIQKRAKELHGKATIISSVGEGTSVTVLM